MGADQNIVKPIKSKIKGMAQFQCKDGILTVDERYTVKKAVGSGAYGHVFSAYDSKTDQ